MHKPLAFAIAGFLLAGCAGGMGGSVASDQGGTGAD